MNAPAAPSDRLRTRRALVEAIQQSPGADGPRLEAAQWFESLGDPSSVARAEFIRVQLERAKRSGHDPIQRELAAREMRLLRQWSRDWASAHPGLRKVIYRRGFAEYLHIHARQFLPWRKQLMALEPIRDVRLTGLYRPRADIVEAVARCPEWRHIETLRLHHQGPHHEPRGLLPILSSPHLSKLTQLVGTHIQVTAEERRQIESLPLFERLHSLTMLSCDTFPNDPGAWFSDSEGPRAGERWTELREFVVPHSYARDGDLPRWTSMPWWSELRSLSCHLDSRAAPQLLEGLPTRLNKLSLSLGYGYGDEAALDEQTILAALAERPLRELMLHLSGGDDQAAWIARTLREPNAWSLGTLEVAALDAALSDAIVDSESTRHLRSLSTGMIDRAAVRTLSAPTAMRLETLSIRGYGNELDEQDVAALFGSDLCGEIASLSLTGLSLTGAMIDALAALPNLAYLDLRNVDLSQLTINRLTSALEDRVWLRHQPAAASEEEVVRRNAEQADGAYRDAIREGRAAQAPERVPPLDGYAGER